MVRAFGCNIRLESACLETITNLDRYAFPSLPRTESSADQPDILIRADRVAETYRLSVDNVLVASVNEASDLALALIRALDDAVVQRLTSLRAVHAGAVLWDRRALLLPGVSHSGKSSLVAELLRRGATYFSDEYALIDPDGLVHPYPRPLLLRNGRPKQSPVLASELNAKVGDAPAPVGWILALQYRPECAWSLQAVAQSEGLLTLLRNTPHALADSPEMLGWFQRAAAGAACYTGQRAEAAQAADEILRLIDS
jgi:hypothetical protein